MAAFDLISLTLNTLNIIVALNHVRKTINPYFGSTDINSSLSQFEKLRHDMSVNYHVIISHLYRGYG